MRNIAEASVRHLLFAAQRVFSKISFLTRACTLEFSKMAVTYPAFVDWFQKQGGTIDLTSMGLREFPASEGGRGAVALKDIEVSLIQLHGSRFAAQ